MNNNHNTSKNDGHSDGQEDKTRHNLRYIDKAINCLSRYCSYAGMSLYGIVYSGVADMIGYEDIPQISDLAQYMIIAAVILFLLALLLSFSEEVFSPVVMHRTTLRGKMSFKRSKTAKVINTMDKRIDKHYKKYFKYSTNTSSKTLKVGDKSKQEELGAKKSNISSEHKQSERCSSVSPQQSNASKRAESTKILPSNVSSETPQHSSESKQTENTRTMTLNSSNQRYQPAGLVGQGNCAGTSSPNISSENLYRASTSKQGNGTETIIAEPQSLNMSAELAYERKELVPYVQRFENPARGQYVPKVKESGIFSFNNFSSSPTGNRPAAEIVATKKMTIFPGGLAQEEYSITQKAFYNCMWCPMGVNPDNPLCLGNPNSSESVLGPDQKNPWCPGSNKSSENSFVQDLNNSFDPAGGIYSKMAVRPNLDNSRNSVRQISPRVDSPNPRSSWHSLQRDFPQSPLNRSFDSSWYPGGMIFPQAVSGPNLCSATRFSGRSTSFKSESQPNHRSRTRQSAKSLVVLHQPGQNQVSNVRTKFESMNI